MKGNFLKLYDAGRVVRFHNVIDYSAAPRQNLADHSWGVAMIAIELCKRERETLSPALLLACLHHDLAEAWLGDLPANTKWEFPTLAAMYTEAEKQVEKRLEIDFDLHPHEKVILKWADSLELFLYCCRRCEGNKNSDYYRVKTNIGDYLTFKAPPLAAGTELLGELYQEFGI